MIWPRPSVRGEKRKSGNMSKLGIIMAMLKLGTTMAIAELDIIMAMVKDVREKRFDFQIVTMSSFSLSGHTEWFNYTKICHLILSWQNC